MQLSEIENAIKNLSDKDKQKLLRALPKLLNLPKESLAWLKLAEPSFAFWDNKEDDIYDSL